MRLLIHGSRIEVVSCQERLRSTKILPCGVAKAGWPEPLADQADVDRVIGPASEMQTGSSTLQPTKPESATPARRREQRRPLWRRVSRRAPAPGGWKLIERIRTGHRWIGGVSAVFVLSLAVTGVLLNHPELLGVDDSRSRVIAYDPMATDVLYRGSDHALDRSLDGGVTWQEVPMLFPAQGVIRSIDGGVVWESFSIGFRPAAEGIKLRRLAVSPLEEMSLITSAGTYVSDAGGENWRPTGDPSSIDLYKAIHQIHSGYYFANWFKYVHDGAGIALISLVFTGFFLLRRRNIKFRRGFRS